MFGSVTFDFCVTWKFDGILDLDGIRTLDIFQRENFIKI